jgi:hypothetical protein
VGLTAVVALAGALPVTASAATRKAIGKTAQGKRAAVWVRDDGSVSLVKLYYRAACRAPGFRSTGSIVFIDNTKQPFVRSGATFSDGGVRTARTREGKTVANSKMTGGPSADGGQEGTFSMALRYYDKRGHRLDFCKTGTLKWKVGPPG